MALREQLTHENLKGLFKSNFELAQYAIRMGRHYLRAGHETTVDGLLEQIRKNPHLYEDVLAQEKADREAPEED
jgi:hypothetical protein